MEMGMRDTLLEIYIKASSKMERLMVEESTSGGMEKFMMVSGTEESRKARDFGRTQKEITTLESGRTRRPMDLGFIYGRMETSTKGNGSTSWSMDEGQRLLEMEISTVETTTKVLQTVKEPTNGRMGESMWVTSSKD
jgi:hypothetical protein